jgi:cytochrome c peroxidase
LRKIIVILNLLGLISISAIIIDKKPTPLKFEIPKGWPKPPKDIFVTNKLTEEGFQLGKRLFYDGNLSKDGQVSCASCHQHFAAFSNYDHDFSHGINNSFTTRNAPALINVAWMNKLHWDGSINHIEVQPLAPLTAPNEMGESLDSILLKLNTDLTYKQMFKAAFGDEMITSQRMLKAIAQFVGCLVSSNSKYDKVMRGEAQFTDYEMSGYKIYKKNCSSCHKEPLFTDNTFRNNGQQLNKYKDIGLQKITHKEDDLLKFKVPTLRNVQLTLPYMHDGHINSLYKVIDFYSTTIDTTQQNLDDILKRKINITKKERIELVYFLFTLTDSSFISNPRFSNANKSMNTSN